MCGGRGTRLGGDVEKPLVPVAGTPMVERVVRALAESRVDDVHAVVSPHTPATRERLRERDGVAVIDAPGDGYVADLGHALARVERPVVTVASDLPLLAGDCVDRVLDRFAGASLAAYVSVDRKRRLGVSVDATATVDGRAVAPTGLNVVADAADEPIVCADDRLAVNVNRPRDHRVAAALAGAP
ncbi:NTP transferase domain-containing protein [Halobaculum litoreum]|uniref:NTP transferase domain-containing protein n=1 Tax=Halobaculum litoreum TaxID=3031998 RepID=A0ABD5XLL9_9EURY|nr:NTP transferase domain-containing protein [Halobaculum sp. DT92]